MNRLALLGLLSAGCAARHDLLLHEGPDLSPRALGVVGVLPAALLQELPGATEGEDPYASGLFVGHVTHSGGYVRELTEDEGSPVRSKETTFTAQDAYPQQAREWLDAALAEELTRSGRQWSRLEAPPVDALPAPRRSRVRGTHELDGTDNVNLPRFTLEPAPWPDAAGRWPGVDTLLLPLVVTYYSHNGGWFIGQDKGCGGGARVRVLLVSYEAATGRVLTWRDLDVRHIDYFTNQPNGAQIDDFLMTAEARFARELRGAIVP